MRCSSCGEEFIPEKKKPGLINQCRNCGIEEEQNRGVEHYRASQAEKMYDWSLMKVKDYFRVPDVTDVLYRGEYTKTFNDKIRQMLHG